jgi:4-hydroxy-4-methyl-2-oxoglutarate aldolase
MEALEQAEGNSPAALSDDVIELARAQAAATVYEAAGQEGAMDAGIHSVAPGMQLCGRALTVRCQPADNLTLHAAVALARPGDIIVANVGDFLEAGHWGEILTVAAQARGIGGLVINGGVRDIEAAQRHGFPVFARGVSMKATVKRVLGDINLPITCGNVSISPGDLVLADDDGVVVIPAGRVEQILRAATERENREADVMRRLNNGELTLDILGFRKLLPVDVAQTGGSAHVG